MTRWPLNLLWALPAMFLLGAILGGLAGCVFPKERPTVYKHWGQHGHPWEAR